MKKLLVTLMLLAMVVVFPATGMAALVTPTGLVDGLEDDDLTVDIAIAGSSLYDALTTMAYRLDGFGGWVDIPDLSGPIWNLFVGSVTDLPGAHSIEFNLNYGPGGPGSGGLFSHDTDDAIITYLNPIDWSNAELPASGPGDNYWGVMNIEWLGFQATTNVTYTGSSPYDGFAPVPLPGAVWLLGSGLIGLVALRRRFNT
jgi:hypothetical protein